MSRYEKYRSVREGIKDLNSKNKQGRTVVEKDADQEDDFLGFLKEPGQAVSRVEHFEDTLEIAKTFDDVKNEPTPEIDRAIKSAKESLGEHEDTRLSILNKIKNPQVEVVTVDGDDRYQTQDFKKGMFINESLDHTAQYPAPKDNQVKEGAAIQEQAKENKRPKSLLERLEEISQKDAKVKEVPKVQGKDLSEVEHKEEKPAFKSEETSPFEDINPDKTIIVARNETVDMDIHDEIGENSKGALILNVIIVILVVIFVLLCCYIAMQIL